jgi:DNA-binding NtrC family response regulator
MNGSPDAKDRILIVDDKKDIRDIVSKILVHMGYEVAKAKDGKEGLGLFLQSPFNLVITDLSIPEGDGMSFAYSIKKQSPHTPVILMTGHTSYTIEKGPVDCIMHKPFTWMDLEKTVKMFLGK